jgi:hypothetical protein
VRRSIEAVDCIAGEMNGNGKMNMDSKMDAELVVDDKKLES